MPCKRGAGDDDHDIRDGREAPRTIPRSSAELLRGSQSVQSRRDRCIGRGRRQRRFGLSEAAPVGGTSTHTTAKICGKVVSK